MSLAAEGRLLLPSPAELCRDPPLLSLWKKILVLGVSGTIRSETRYKGITFRLLSRFNDLLRDLFGSLDLRLICEADIHVAIRNIGLQQG